MARANLKVHTNSIEIARKSIRQWQKEEEYSDIAVYKIDELLSAQPEGSELHKELTKQRKYYSDQSKDAREWIKFDSDNIKKRQEYAESVKAEISHLKSEGPIRGMIGKFFENVKQVLSVGKQPEGQPSPLAKIAERLGVDYDDVQATAPQSPR